MTEERVKLQDLIDNARDLEVEVELINDPDDPRIQLVVCTWLPEDERPFDDDIETTCSFCGTPLIHRPHAPKKPPKACVGCAMKHAHQARLN